MRVKLGDAGVMSRQRFTFKTFIFSLFRAEAKKKHRDLDTIKIDPVVDISIGFSREAAWDNILCRHNNSLIVSTWTSKKAKMGKHKVNPSIDIKHNSLVGASPFQNGFIYVPCNCNGGMCIHMWKLCIHRLFDR